MSEHGTSDGRDVTRQRLRELNAQLEQRVLEGTAELELLSEELDRGRAYLETIVQHIPAGLVIADAATGVVTMANERAREIAGLELGGVVYPGQGRRSLHGADGSPLARALAGETVNGERMAVERRDGSPIVLELSAAPICDARGEVVAAAMVFLDVTLAEARRRASVEFVANAAHELRTPLAAIVSGVEVLESGAKEVPVERDRFLTHIGREAERLVRLTRALLMLARISSGVEEARAEVLELAPLLTSVADGLRPAAGVKVLVRCRSNAAAIANRGLLEQALTSVATNAARYTESGRIALSVAQRTDASASASATRAAAWRPSELARASERFFRGDPRRRRAASASASRSPTRRCTPWAARSRSRRSSGTAPPSTSSFRPRGW